MNSITVQKRFDTAQHDDERVFAKLNPGGLKRLSVFIRPYRIKFVLVLLTVAIYTVGQVLLPMVIREAVNVAIGHSHRPLWWAISFFVGIAVFNAFLGFLQEYNAAQLAQRVIFDLRRAMFAHLQDVSLSFLDRTQVGRLMSRLQGDVNALQEFLEQSITALGDLFLLLGITVVLVAMNLRLGLMTLSLLPVLIVARILWIPWAQKRFHRARDASSTVNAALAENINGIRTVQESRRENINFERYERKARENFEAAIGSAQASQSMVPAVDFLTGIAMAIIVVAGGNAVLHNTMGVGEMVAYIFYVQQFFDPIRTLSMQYTVAQRAMVATHRIFEVLDIPIDVKDKPSATPVPSAPPSVSFRGVTFGYRKSRPILRDVSFDVAPYQSVALVGPTGSGKSSIASLLHRFYDVWSGEVLVAGKDVRDVTQASLGRTIAMVLQEPFLFSITVMDNLRYCSTSATDEQVIAAAKAVRAHDFIINLPQGYQTVLGQWGRNLSIGQRQLLSFARALVADPKILILDEATANIDSFTEMEIQRALAVLLKGRTSVMIAHRLATIRNADVILVLRKGEIVEQGSHTQLLARGGLYAKLYSSSHSSFDELVPSEVVT